MTDSNPATGAPGEPVRLGIIGAGVFARKAHVPALLAMPERFRVVAVCSRTRASAESLAALLPDDPEIYTDVDATCSLRDVEALDVVLPIPLQRDVVRKALATGKHVVSEKPIAGSVMQARDLIDLHRERPEQVWMVAENWRYERAFLEAAAAIRHGRIGAPIAANWSVHFPMGPGDPYYETAWRRSGEVPGGYLLDIGVHYAAALRMLLGEVREVQAVVHGRRPDLPPADTLAATLRFDGDVLGSFSLTVGAGTPWPGALEVVGSDGALRVRPGLLEVAAGDDSGTTTFDERTGVRDELAAFAAAIRERMPHRNAPEAALRDLAVIEGMLRAATRGPIPPRLPAQRA